MFNNEIITVLLQEYLDFDCAVRLCSTCLTLNNQLAKDMAFWSKWSKYNSKDISVLKKNAINSYLQEHYFRDLNELGILYKQQTLPKPKETAVCLQKILNLFNRYPIIIEDNTWLLLRLWSFIQFYHCYAPLDIVSFEIFELFAKTKSGNYYIYSGYYSDILRNSEKQGTSKLGLCYKKLITVIQDTKRLIEQEIEQELEKFIHLVKTSNEFTKEQCQKLVQSINTETSRYLNLLFINKAIELMKNDINAKKFIGESNTLRVMGLIREGQPIQDHELAKSVANFYLTLTITPNGIEDFCGNMDSPACLMLLFRSFYKGGDKYTKYFAKIICNLTGIQKVDDINESLVIFFSWMNNKRNQGQSSDGFRSPFTYFGCNLFYLLSNSSFQQNHTEEEELLFLQEFRTLFDQQQDDPEDYYYFRHPSNENKEKNNILNTLAQKYAGCSYRF